MADKYTASQRHQMMSSVKSKGNKSTEIALATLLRKHKLSGWRRHYPIEGTPDFVFPKEKVAIFVDGCFWHKCPKCYRRPQSNTDYWDQKAENNRKRDASKREKLRRSGWRVVRVWEHELKEESATVVREVAKYIR